MEILTGLVSSLDELRKAVSKKLNNTKVCKPSINQWGKKLGIIRGNLYYLFPKM